MPIVTCVQDWAQKKEPDGLLDLDRCSFQLALDAFVAALRAHGKLLATLATARAQNVASTDGGHAAAKAVLVATLPY